MAKKNKGGRPVKFNNPEEITKAAEAYFKRCKDEEEPITVTGLAIALDTTRETLNQYGKKQEFSDAIKKAKLRVEHYAEIRLFGPNPAGAIFALKNFGWSDRATPEEKDLEIEEDYTLSPDEEVPDGAVL